jgi:uncharacterized protein (TIGR02391 family)
VTAPKHPPFPSGALEQTCKLIGDLYSGSELTRIMAEIPLKNDLGEGNTKWRRLAFAVSSNQAATGSGNALIALITVSMRPDRIFDRADAAHQSRDELNQVLSLVGLRVRDDGKVARTTRAQTTDEARDRTERLRTLLRNRGAHQEVLAYCRSELLRKDYYEAVFEAIKGLGSRMRQLTGLDADGYGLVESAMAGSSPMLRINALQTRTQRDEQLGVANLAKGLFSAFRNPVAHEPRIEWTLTEQDALDVLGTLSMIHRRIDHAVLAPDI